MRSKDERSLFWQKLADCSLPLRSTSEQTCLIWQVDITGPCEERLFRSLQGRWSCEAEKGCLGHVVGLSEECCPAKQEGGHHHSDLTIPMIRTSFIYLHE